MLVWKNAKYWKYRCRACAVQTADFGDGDLLYRASIELDDVIGDDVDLNRALPVDGHVSMRKRARADRSGEYSAWIHARLHPEEGDGIDELAQQIRDIADELDELDL